MTHNDMMHLFSAIAVAGWALWRVGDLALGGRPRYPALGLACVLVAVMVVTQTGVV